MGSLSCCPGSRPREQPASAGGVPTPPSGRFVKPAISYPIADGGGGRAVPIEKAVPGALFTCFGCLKPMVARKGSKRAWHFAHKPPVQGCADPDWALHETAKALILQGFTAALEAGGEYRVGFSCEDCGRDSAWNTALPARSISVERSVVEGTRSDVVVDRGAKPALIIEVVVTHDLEPATRIRYENSGLPVFVDYPTWDTVAGRARGVIADAVINIPSMRCPRCEEEEERWQREFSEAQTWAESLVRGLRAGASNPVKSAGPNVRTWQHDKFGRAMFPQVRRRVFRNAAILLGLGFVQAKEKPWLLLYRLPEGCGLIFANFGSSDEVPIWEDTSALIHWQLNGRSEVEEHALVPLVLAICREAGAEVRVSFYHHTSIGEPPL